MGWGAGRPWRMAGRPRPSSRRGITVSSEVALPGARTGARTTGTRRRRAGRWREAPDPAAAAPLPPRAGQGVRPRVRGRRRCGLPRDPEAGALRRRRSAAGQGRGGGTQGGHSLPTTTVTISSTRFTLPPPLVPLPCLGGATPGVWPDDPSTNRRHRHGHVILHPLPPSCFSLPTAPAATTARTPHPARRDSAPGCSPRRSGRFADPPESR